MLKKKKMFLLSSMKEILENNLAMCFFSFSSLSAFELSELRRVSSSAELSLVVLKKSLANIALRDAGLEWGGEDSSSDSLAVLYAKDDIVSVAKCLTAFEKAVGSERVKFLFGFLNRAVVSDKEFEKLSKIPSEEILRATLLHSMMSVHGVTVSTLSGLHNRLHAVLFARLQVD